MCENILDISVVGQ